MNISSDTLVQQVTKALVHYINTGIYIPGERLPSIEKLASSFGLGRSTVRESLKELESLGVIEVRHGGGVFLSNFRASHCAFPLAMQTIDARSIIEVNAAVNAARSATTLLIEELDCLFSKMKLYSDEGNLSLFAYADRQFHYRISQQTENVLIMKYHTSLELLFNDVQNLIICLPQSNQIALDDHFDLLQAIRNHDVEQAELCARRHIDHIKDQVQNIPADAIHQET